MLRSIKPRARALWGRARHSVTVLVVGVALALPATAFVVGEGTAKTSPKMETSSVAAVRSPARPVAPSLSVASSAAVSSTSSGSAATRAVKAKETEARTARRYSHLYSVPVRVATEIQRAAVIEGISPRVAFGLVHTESNFKRTAVSPVGAIGYTQVMPATARSIRPGTTRAALFNGRINLHLGFHYLKSLMEHYDGNVRLALTAYNRGPGIVDQLVRHGHNPANGYARKVLAGPRG